MVCRVGTRIMNKKVVAEVIEDKLILTYKPYYGTDFIEKTFLDGNTEILLFHRCVSVGKTDITFN